MVCCILIKNSNAAWGMSRNMDYLQLSSTQINHVFIKYREDPPFLMEKVMVRGATSGVEPLSPGRLD